MYKLIIGNKNYSSWSLRGWLAWRMAKLEFQAELLRLDLPDYKQQIRNRCAAGTVPILILPDGTTIAESLAIIETANELCHGKLCPQAASTRAHARAYAAEMHAGFTALRDLCPMNIRKKFPNFPLTEAAQADVRRIESMWIESLSLYGPQKQQGDFLFGEFSIADAMFAPVVMRFIGYDIQLNNDHDGLCQKYMQNIIALPAMQEWITAAQKETWLIPEDEASA